MKLALEVNGLPRLFKFFPMKKHLFFLVLLVVCSCGTDIPDNVVVTGTNPIIHGQFTADPTARVFDGKLYMYPSHDIPSLITNNGQPWFTMADYHVFSSEDLTVWTDHGVILKQEDVPWGNPEAFSMWAPDCVYKDGKYYFYFPDAPGGEGRRGFAVGVAVADHPEGPFTPQPEPIEGIFGIDPCVLIDDDGSSYIYWSGGGLRGAGLKDNMFELEGGSVNLDETLPPGFKEGPFVFKHNGNYYLTYPWVRYENGTEALAYAMSDSPLGPFEYKGIIMKESPVKCWTNHHSIVNYNGEWLLFYHHNDYSPDFDKNRSARIDRLYFNEDGTIQEVIPTLRGVGPVKATSQVHIDRYSSISGAEIDYLDPEDTFKGWKTIFDGNGDSVVFDELDFGESAPRKAVVRIRTSGEAPMRISAVSSAEVVLPYCPDWKEFTVSLRLEGAVGKQSLEIESLSDEKVEIDWIKFK